MNKIIKKKIKKKIPLPESEKAREKVESKNGEKDHKICL